MWFDRDRSSETERSCCCLNVIVVVVEDKTVLSPSESQLLGALFARASMDCETMTDRPESTSPPKTARIEEEDISPNMKEQRLHAYSIKSKSVKHPILTTVVEVQGWTVLSCECCQMVVFATDLKEGGFRAVIDAACAYKSDFPSLRASPHFSKTFGILIKMGAGLWLEDKREDSEGCPAELLTVATGVISHEKASMQEKVRAFEYDQVAKFESFRQQALAELQALAGIMKRSSPGRPTKIQIDSSLQVDTPSPRLSQDLGTPGTLASLSTARLSASSRNTSSPLATDLEDDSIFEFEEDLRTVEEASLACLQRLPLVVAGQDLSDESEEDASSSPRMASSAPRLLVQALKSVGTRGPSGYVKGSQQKGEFRGVQGREKEFVPPYPLSSGSITSPRKLLQMQKEEEEKLFENAVRFQALSFKARAVI